MSDHTHVPDKLHAYSLQVRHMLYELISVEPELTVSTEAFDDVALDWNKKIQAEQLKSALSDQNPLANRSEAFWKSIYNWCTYIDNGELPADKEILLRYIVIANRDFAEGVLPKAIHESKSDLDVDNVIHLIEKEFYDKDSKPPAEDYKEYIQYIIEVKNRNTVQLVIKSLEIVKYSGDYDEKLMKRFCTQAIPTEYVKELFYCMLGWVNDQVHKQTGQNKPAYISVNAYRDALKAHVRRMNIQTILTAVSAKPSGSEAAAEVQADGTYIRQLRLIDAPDDELVQAASDFLRSKCEVTEWSKRGIIVEQSLEEYSDYMVRMWKTKKTQISLMNQFPGKSAGQYLYETCKETALSVKMQGSTPPPFFGSGYLHNLADAPADHPKIGWHPNYVQLLQEHEEDESIE